MEKINNYSVETYKIKNKYYLDIILISKLEGEPARNSVRRIDLFEAWIYEEENEIKKLVLRLPAERYSREEFLRIALTEVEGYGLIDKYSVEYIDGYKEYLAGGEELYNYTMGLPPVKYNLKPIGETDILIGMAYQYKNEYYEIQIERMYEGEITLSCDCLKSNLYQPKILMMNREVYFNLPSDFFQYEAVDMLCDYLEAAKITVEEIKKKIKIIDKK